MLRLTAFGLVLGLIFLVTTAEAQTGTRSADQRDGLTVTASASDDRVRFTADASVVQIRLEVYDSRATKLFDNDLRGGNVLDWHLQDGQAERLPDDTYLCVVTVKSLSGKITQRIGSLILSMSTARMQSVAPSSMTQQQTDAIGPVEEESSLTVIEGDRNRTTTLLAHDGTDGHVTRGQGALTFRLGDFYGGKDREQMRLTPEGNLGIGITHPEARLDVDGLIRTSQGIVFPDGSIQFSAARKTFGAASLTPGQLQHTLGQDAPLVPDTSGTGTTGKVPKWQDGPNGVLNDSNITEVSGAIGINGPPDTRFRLDVNGSTRLRGSNPGFNLVGLRPAGNEWVFQTVDDDGRFRLFGQDNATGFERLTISLSTGNVGVGKSVPQSRLDVQGDVAASQYRDIANRIILSTHGGTRGHVTVGPFAGERLGLNFSDTMVGEGAGKLTQSDGGNGGSFNSFFGSFAGQANTFGSNNTFIGSMTGQSNSTEDNNTFIGYQADGVSGVSNGTALGANSSVTRSNSLVLGATGVNVGIGATSPEAPLHLQRDGDIGANWQNAQLRISGATDANMEINLGYDTTNNLGVIQAGHANVAFKNLVLNPFGGAVGIGTTNPHSLLHVKGASPVRILADPATLSGSEYVDFMARSSAFSSDLGGLRIQRQAATGNIDTLIFAAPTGNAASEMMRISGNGNVGIGVTAPIFQLQLSSDSAAKPNGGSWSNPSDARLKENIHPFTDGLAVLRQINPVSYRLNGKAGMPKGEPGIGIIAQEVRDLLPYTITTFKAKLEAGDAEPAELLAFNSSALTFVLINAVKEISSRLDALHASSKQDEVTALKQENEAQRQRIADLDARLAAMEQTLKKLMLPGDPSMTLK